MQIQKKNVTQVGNICEIQLHINYNITKIRLQVIFKQLGLQFHHRS